MADEPKKEDGIIQKALGVFENYLDSQLQKSEEDKKKSPDLMEDDDILYRKSAYKDPSYTIGATGYQEKTSRLSFYMLREMAKRDTVVSAIIQNYQNDVSDFAKPARAKYDKGFKIVPKNERIKILQKIEEMFGKQEDEFNKAEAEEKLKELKEEPTPQLETKPEEKPANPESIEDFNDKEPGTISQRDKERLAREQLYKDAAEEIYNLTQLVMSCGSLENRSFEDKRWNFESMLRAIVRDSLTYDQYAIERVFDMGSGENAQPALHHWVPVDAGTIRFSTPALKQQKGQVANEFALDILYPEKELEALENNDAIELDEQKLQDDEYKWVQVVRGKIERAFTEKELCVGMRNPTTDIYSNGYAIAELEVLMNTISSHIFTENYNRLYFTQGFSAKGILHIKAPLPRRKLEAFRIQWHHLLKGNKNSFQTPIVSGMEDIQWIPLTQNHSDMEFSNWMNYLIKVICSIYQIDPIEIGFGMKEEGGRGGTLGGDNSKEKIKLSKEKGLKPLLTHLQTFMNQHIISQINDEYELQFVGLDDESQREAIERQEKEVKFKKTINEVRAEDDLPPLDGCDKLILDPNYMNWFSNMSPDGLDIQQKKNEMMMQSQGLQDGSMADPAIANKLESQKDEEKEEEPKDQKDQKDQKEEVQKSLVAIEHYTLPEK